MLLKKCCYLLDSAYIRGTVAQSVEQWTENPCVGGSIPPGPTFKKPLIIKQLACCQRLFLWGKLGEDSLF